MDEKYVDKASGKYVCQYCGSTNTRYYQENDIDQVHCLDCDEFDTHWDESREY